MARIRLNQEYRNKIANRCHGCGCTPKNDEWSDRAKNLCIDCKTDEE